MFIKKDNYIHSYKSALALSPVSNLAILCALCYWTNFAIVIVHSCEIAFQRRLRHGAQLCRLATEFLNYWINNIILPPHVTNMPIDIEALTSAVAFQVCILVGLY